MHKFSADVVLRWRDDSQWLLLFSFTLHGFTVEEVFCILKNRQFYSSNTSLFRLTLSLITFPT